ncbi:MAG: hypothetical protein ACKO4T_07445 [Planctomycetaceae bacterium]
MRHIGAPQELEEQEFRPDGQPKLRELVLRLDIFVGLEFKEGLWGKRHRLMSTSRSPHDDAC